jgi:hypothetical protein
MVMKEEKLLQPALSKHVGGLPDAGVQELTLQLFDQTTEKEGRWRRSRGQWRMSRGGSRGWGRQVGRGPGQGRGRGWGRGWGG